jgi:hypothetical protein
VARAVRGCVNPLVRGGAKGGVKVARVGREGAPDDGTWSGAGHGATPGAETGPPNRPVNAYGASLSEAMTRADVNPQVRGYDAALSHRAGIKPGPPDGREEGRA